MNERFRSEFRWKTTGERTGSEERLLQGHYSGQIADIAETVQESGTEVTPTYLSPTPYFKSSSDYLYGHKITANLDTLEPIDVLSWDAPTISDSPDTLVGTTNLWDEAMGRPIINTEYEHLDGDVDFVHTAKEVHYHFSYYDSPTFFWLHALKPMTTSEWASSGSSHSKAPSRSS